MAAKKCDFMRRAKSQAEREAGCPLDHCECGTHNPDHDCGFDEEWRRERAMQAGMGLGVDAYNDEMGY